MLNTHYYRNNAANFIYKSAISPSSSSPHVGCSVLSTYYYRNNPANYMYKSAISPYSSSPHGGCSILNTYYYRNNPANYIYKSAISSSSSSPHTWQLQYVRAARSPAVSTSGRTLNVVLLARASQGAAVSHAVTPDHSEQIFGSRA